MTESRALKRASGGPSGGAPPTGFPPGTAGLIPELRWRGMFHDASDGLEARLATGRSIAGYIGFDPSGPWLHIGHLVPIFGLIQLQRHGGRPIAVVGGGTGMIGDPSGRSSERNLLDRSTLAANVASMRGQLERFLDFSPSSSPSGGAAMVNNLDWLGEIMLLDFLRDVGKHFTIPYMLAKESVQLRLERGLSFTEFSYMLIQATDFAHLHRTMGVELQMGGADQWGNLTAGLELIRRTSGDVLTSDANEPIPGGYLTSDSKGEEESITLSPDRAFALAYPLLLTPSGAKFGKSEGGESVWLHPDGTSPFTFYQHWLNTDDRDVSTYLRWFTTFSSGEIEALEAELAARPEARGAQRALAYDITARTHGREEADRAVSASEAAFSGQPIDDPAVLATLHKAADGFEFRAADLAAGAVPFLVASGTFSSNGEARRMITGGGVTVNGRRLASPDDRLPGQIAGEWMVIRVGKRKLRIGRRVA